MTHSPTTVLFLLFVLAAAAWLVYRMLENVQDNYNGLTLEQSIAKRDTRRLADRKPPRSANAHSRKIAAPPAAAAAPTPGDARALRLYLSESEARSTTGSTSHYPKVLYKCPVVAFSELGRHARSAFGSHETRQNAPLEAKPLQKALHVAPRDARPNTIPFARSAGHAATIDKAS